MLTQFIFKIGGNPYITTNNKELFRMFCKYTCEQFDNHSFVVIEKREWNGKPGYNGKKEVARAIAIEWQNNFADRDYSYLELNGWQSFFEEIGARFGLLREYKENGII